MSAAEVAPRIHRIDSIMGTRLLSQWFVRGTAHFPTMEGEAMGEFLDRSRRLTDKVESAPTIEGDPVAALLGPVAARLGGYPEMDVELARSIGAHLEARA